MPRGVKKADLPEKICVVCNRPFTWRKVYEKCWDEVRVDITYAGSKHAQHCEHHAAAAANCCFVH